MPTTPSAPLLELHGVRTVRHAGLFKLRGHIRAETTTMMIDSGATTEFIDTAFARRCGLTLTPSNRTIRLADGSIVPADGDVTVSFTLAPSSRNGSPIPFTATFTATPLQGYDAILGMTWLAKHDPIIGWAERNLAIRMPDGTMVHVRPLESSTSQPTAKRLATITTHGLKKAIRRGECDELFAVFVKPKDDATATTGPPRAKEHPAAEALLLEYADVFPDQLPNGLPPARGMQHRIELKPGARPPPPRPLRHQSPRDLAVFEEYTRTMIEAGQLRVSTSPFGAMALIVRKKDGTARVVIDYRGLNEITIKNKYPLPLMDEMFDRVHGAKFFTKIDLRSGFHQIRIDDADCEKTAFRTRYGSFEYRVLPMGLCNAPGTFMQLMNDTFRDLLDKSVLVFLDDILVFSRTLEEHTAHVREVLDRLRKQQLYAKLSKCELFRDEVEFLGHRIGVNGLSVMADKVDAVRDWPQPRSVTDVRAFLGLAGFYRRFVKDFSRIALPITELTKEMKEPFRWTPEADAAFGVLKQALCSAPILIIADPSLPYTLNCDACQYAIGATLQQDHGNGLQPVAFMSRKLKDAEKNYDTREKECLSLVRACEHWRQYLHSDLPFKLMTDHDSLKYLKTMPEMKGRIARWVEKMSEYDFTIEHIAGVKNVVADALSRRADLRDADTPTMSPAAIELEKDTDAVSLSTMALGTVEQFHRRIAAGVAPPARLAAVARVRVVESPVLVAANRVLAKKAAEESRLIHPGAARLVPNAQGVIVMPSQRCTANTKKGAHCKQITAKGQFCWNHLRSESALRIKMSKVPGAGMGLHAARDLPAGTSIDYTGDRVPVRGIKDGGVYFLQLNEQIAIDAARTNAGYGRWVNDPRGSGLRANAKFVIHTPPGGRRVGCVRTLRLVKAGEEICVPYGLDYWRFYAAQPPVKQPRKRAGRKQRPLPPPPIVAAPLPLPPPLIVAAPLPPPPPPAAALPLGPPRPRGGKWSRKRGRPDALAAIVVSTTAITSALLDGAVAAAKADVAYMALLASPQPNVVEKNGLLWRDGRILIVPNDATLRTRILAECHDTVTAAHFGRDKTLAAVKVRFEWEGMSTAVESYVATCDACQRNKPSQQLTPGALMPLPLPDRPCDEWTTDAVTGLPMTKRGHDSIQVFVERLCKVKHFAATRKDYDAAAMASCFVHTVVRPHGMPLAVISDRDPRFTAKYYAELTKLMGIDLRMSTARHPQSDGQSEREVRTIITALRAFCNDNQNDWDDYLDMLELGFNCTVQSSTQCSPYELLYGCKPRLPIDVALTTIAPRNPSAIDRATRMQQAMVFGRDHLLAAQQRQADNASRRPASLAVGDQVMLSIEGLTIRGFDNKLAGRYVGPFAVTAVVNANAYTLALPPQLKALHPTFNIDKLKLYRDGMAAFPSRPRPFARPPPVAVADSNGDAVWEVERITAQRKHGRAYQYLVSWKGYPAEENTWESRANLRGSAKRILAEWDRLQSA